MSVMKLLRNIPHIHVLEKKFSKKPDNLFACDNWILTGTDHHLYLMGSSYINDNRNDVKFLENLNKKKKYKVLVVLKI